MLTMLTEFKQVSMYCSLMLFNFTKTVMYQQNCVTSQHQISCMFVQWLMIYYLQTYRETG